MNFVAFIMELIEGLYEKFCERSAKVNNFDKIKDQRKFINFMNFEKYHKKEKLGKNEKFERRGKFGRKVVPIEEDESMI